MKRLGLGALFELGLLVILFGVIVHAPITVGFGSLWPEYATAIKAWKELLMIVLGVMAILLLTRQKAWPELYKNRIVQLSGAFVAAHLLLIPLFGGDIFAIIAGLMIDLRFIAFFVLMYVLIKLRPQAISRIVKVAAAGAVLVVTFGLLQITVLPDDVLSSLGYSTDTIRPFTTIDNNTDFVRINSTMRGPNPLGALAVVYITLLLAYLLKRGATASVSRRWGVMAAAVGTGAVLFASFSRSAYLALLAAIITLFFVFQRPSKRLILIGIGLLVIGSVGGILLSSTDWYSNVVLHEDPESTVASKSNEEHVNSLVTGAERVLAQPFGAGIGSTGSASLYDDESSNDFIVENYYFFVAHESGWLGLGLFLALFVATLRALWMRRYSWLGSGLFASGIGLFVIGLLLPVWVDETVAIVWWGIAGAMVATSGIMEDSNAKRSRQQKTTRTT